MSIFLPYLCIRYWNDIIRSLIFPIQKTLINQAIEGFQIKNPQNVWRIKIFVLNLQPLFRRRSRMIGEEDRAIRIGSLK